MYPRDTPTIEADPLKDKSTLEKIAIEALLMLGDTFGCDDSRLNENETLLRVDWPPAIPIEPKGIIPLVPINPETVENPDDDNETIPEEIPDQPNAQVTDK